MNFVGWKKRNGFEGKNDNRWSDEFYKVFDKVYVEEGYDVTIEELDKDRNMIE